jgi:hypothetical protein
MLLMFAFKWPIKLIVLMLCLRIECGGQIGSGGTSKIDAQVSEVPAVELDIAGEIPAIDFAIDDKEALHVVWRAVLSDGNRPSLGSDKIFYVRGDRGGATWSQPILVGDNRLSDDCLRILIGHDRLHILFGRKLRHFVSNDDGRSWRELAPLIPNEESRADRFDASVIGDSLIVTYLFHPRPAYEVDKRTAKDDQKLYVVRRSPAETSVPALIASFPASPVSPPPPRIVTDGERLHLMCGINAERRKGMAFGIAGNLFYLRSDDGGVTWSLPVETSADARKGATSSGRGYIQTLGSIELLPTPERLYAFYHDTLLFLTYTTDGKNWSPAFEIGDKGRRGALATYHSDSASVAAVGHQGRLAWIDTRFRKTDRERNLLGGIPWSDDPDWKNNDILSLPVSDILALPTSGTHAKAQSAPARLTEPLSYANAVRVRASKTRLFVLWSGRSKAGKQLDTFGQKPRLFYTTLPLS